MALMEKQWTCSSTTEKFQTFLSSGRKLEDAHGTFTSEKCIYFFGGDVETKSLEVVHYKCVPSLIEWVATSTISGPES